MTLRAVIVDDEEPARDRMAGLLEPMAGLEVVGSAADGEQARQVVAELRPDVLFLDIEMPGMSGLELAALLPPPRPHIVFCTAYDDYALEAFEQQAVDYLLKPVRRDRLARTIDRIASTRGEVGRLRNELELAERTQARLYPSAPPPLPSLDYAGLCRPARAVGGDYYDFLPLGAGELGLAIGDVSGKGIFAALLMAGLQARVQSEAPRHGRRVDQLAEELGRRMHEATEANRYATLFYAHYDDATRRLTWTNAAQLPPFLIRGASSQAAAERLETCGSAIGLLPGSTYSCRSTALQPGDLLCMISDGVSEAPGPAGEEFGEARVLELLRRHGDLSAAALCEKMAAEVDRFRGAAPVHDDLTVVVARIR